MSSLGGVEAFTYIKTKESKETNKKYPDIEILFVGGGMQTDQGLIYRKAFAFTDEIYEKFWKPLEDKNSATLCPLLMHPKSYGYIELTSKSPLDAPKFHGRYFTDPENSDIKTFIAAIREVQRIMEFPSMQRYDAKLHNVPLPGCEHLEFDSDDYWECALRHVSATLHHQVGTCKMGPDQDPEAVVDNELKVYGVKNLRVADCSVIPLPLTAHTNAPGIMIGEKLSDLLKEKWLNSWK
ncbi:glucose dehydrogenase [FAD, quinone]-like isoform X2 [Harmonia axyridis]|uniref:glucose dehydrogenase [FAD, quinone]-like isoform X2 n=1 Tax=Harmonia axyridis TaxID=115357 RepID=UPI001E2777F7|nr:glucose dehydrogenase [FAD, quinone]-like isoform X2 [Harmonia axyridis]